MAFVNIGILANSASADIKTEPVDYRDGDVELQGFVAYDDSTTDKRPVVLVVPEWWGLNEYAKERARQLAQMGYVGFAVDMYGKDVVTTDKDRAGELAGKLYGDAKLWRGRITAGLKAAQGHPRVDATRVAAIGFCFGGSTVLQLAYTGADVDGVVSFHGGLAPPDAGDGEIKAKILILHGADDPMVPDAKVQPVIEALRAKKADWQLVYYGGAVHSFSNPKAGGTGIPGVAYHKATADRSWRLMKSFLDELFGSAAPLPGAPQPE
jgi:dienelactone hydrolase